MPSPFPGMNPYFESDVWHDFHQAMIPAFRDALVPQVRPEFIVMLEQHIYIHELPAGERLVGRADVSVSNTERRSAQRDSVAVLTPPEYTLIKPAVDIERESYLEVRDRRTRELVTVVELLSPSNKRPGPDREAYIAKRDQLLHSQAHFVEIDLLRGWERMPAESDLACDYCVIVSRVEERPRAGVWRIGIRESLPEIPVPLRPPHSDAVIDLRGVLDRVYDAAGYGDYLYDSRPNPPLSLEDALWAEQLLSRM